jgi:hypothetical protein
VERHGECELCSGQINRIPAEHSRHLLLLRGLLPEHDPEKRAAVIPRDKCKRGCAEIMGKQKAKARRDST